jgi:hypothetical protein
MVCYSLAWSFQWLPLPTDEGQVYYWLSKSSQSSPNSLLLVLFFTAFLQAPFCTTHHCPSYVFLYPDEGFPADRKTPSTSACQITPMCQVTNEMPPLQGSNISQLFIAYLNSLTHSIYFDGNL